jgi:hypothetical protein
MPRRSKNAKNENTATPEKPSKKNLMNTIVKDITIVENEDIILQLPISEAQISEINNEDKLNYEVPEPYEPNCCYISDNNIYQNIQNNNIDNQYFDDAYNQGSMVKSTNNCYWCCYPIENRTYGMPYKYNSATDTYTLYGNFCSLECASAYNFSVNNGSDKVWEINSFIQMLSKHYAIKYPIRPAPSRFLLKFFNGPLSIEEFRTAHLTNDKTHIINLPPMISTNFNYEVVNTSYLKNITDNMNIVKNNSTSISSKKQPKNTIDNKLNLIIS